ncbi:hypothetical protein Tco_1264397 [Tanacetum coccineum]
MSDSEALNEQPAKLFRALNQIERQILSGQYHCSCCGGPKNGGNCPGCTIVGTGTEFVYDQNPYSYNEIPNFFNQSPQHPIQTYSYEFCGGNPHPAIDCQTGNTPVYDQVRTLSATLLKRVKAKRIDDILDQISRTIRQTQEQIKINQEKVNMDFQNELNHLQEMMNLINSSQDPPVDLYHLEGSEKGDNKIDSLTMEPFDTFLMGDEVISTTPERKNDEFIKSSVYALVPILRESEVTSVYHDLECDIPTTTLVPTTDVREENFDINLPLGEM